MAASFISRTFLSYTSCGSIRTLKDAVAVGCTRRNFVTTGKYQQANSEDDKLNTVQNSQGATHQDPFPIFSKQEVQGLLERITGFNALKVAGPQKKPLQRAVYKLLTDEQLDKELQEAHGRLKEKLQMPPFMNPYKDNTTPLSLDPDLADFDTAKYVFTDISYGVKDRHRHVVVRELDGSLNIAPRSTRERMNQIYNPREGREFFKPRMFNEQNLERMISKKQYIYILDRACCQFEPDDPDYVNVTRRVYSAVNDAKAFEDLRSTRHFGCLAFYLVWNRMSDLLLLDMLNRDLISDAKDLVILHCIIHPDSQCATSVGRLEKEEPVAVVKAYIETEAKLKAQLELSLQAMEDAMRTKEKSEERSSS
ncbi:unnamed protein product [Candidula unifasciata]|uniref:28S ribosomal protein S22, mitochondrial n=1 Tax=Candidula unifasciata TaxID=100452 RepID=A0A8S3YW05_9EUPU|nr:unnamed protein product [Candidula unifasciata]